MVLAEIKYKIIRGWKKRDPGHGSACLLRLRSRPAYNAPRCEALMPFIRSPYRFHSRSLCGFSGKSLILIAFGVISLELGNQGLGMAFTCPDQPKQISKDFEGEVNTQVGKIGPVSGGELKIKAKQTTRDLLEKANERDRVYLEQMMYASYCTSLQDNKALSPSEITQNIRDYNSVVRGTIKTERSASVPSPPKRLGKEKGSVTRSGDNPPVMSPTLPEQRQLESEKQCQQSLDGLKRRPEVFLPTWRSVVTDLRKKRLIHDLQNLFEVWGRIPVGLTGKDLIYEGLFTLKCSEDIGELRMEKLGTTGRYWGEDFENQRINFRNP